MFFCIISESQKDSVEQLGKTLGGFHPGCPIFVLVVDQEKKLNKSTEQIKFFRLADIEKDHKHLRLRSYAMALNKVELRKFLEPFFATWIFDHTNVSQLFYFDLDTYFTASLDLATRALENNSLLLLPHVLSDLETLKDGLRPSYSDFIDEGFYLTEFYGLARNRDLQPLLRDWRSFAIDFAQRGDIMKVHQKFFEWTRFHFTQVKILKNSGYGLNVFNFHERDLKREEGRWMVGDLPVVFFQMRNFPMSNPLSLSSEQTRFGLPVGGALSALCREYSFFAAGNRKKTAAEPRYNFDYFRNGVRVSPIIRTIMRKSIANLKFEDPFDSSGKNSFFHWLTTDSADSPPPLVLEMHNDRIDVQKHFPNPYSEEGHRGLLRWAAEEGFKEHSLDPKIGMLLKIESETRYRKLQYRHPMRGSQGRLSMGATVGFGVNFFSASRDAGELLQNLKLQWPANHIQVAESGRIRFPPSLFRVSIFDLEVSQFENAVHYYGQNLLKNRFNILWVRNRSKSMDVLALTRASEYFAEVWVDELAYSAKIASTSLCPVIPIEKEVLKLKRLSNFLALRLRYIEESNSRRLAMGIL